MCLLFLHLFPELRLVYPDIYYLSNDLITLKGQINYNTSEDDILNFWILPCLVFILGRKLEILCFYRFWDNFSSFCGAANKINLYLCGFLDLSRTTSTKANYKLCPLRQTWPFSVTAVLATYSTKYSLTLPFYNSPKDWLLSVVLLSHKFT